MQHSKDEFAQFCGNFPSKSIILMMLECEVHVLNSKNSDSEFNIENNVIYFQKL